jgi:hypothetical protein
MLKLVSAKYIVIAFMYVQERKRYFEGNRRNWNSMKSSVVRFSRILKRRV